MAESTHYIGNELELFSHARNWKAYWGKFIQPFLGKKVLEAGSGIGGTTKYLLNTPGVEKWVCLEPDADLVQLAENAVKGIAGADKLVFANSYLADYNTDERFDAILYADVIEHIEKDADELVVASSFLNPGGHLIVIVPAHQFLFSEFDKAIGHYRRYSRESLRRVIPADIKVVKLHYLDSVGLLASMSNKLLLKQRYPTIAQVKFWDSTIVPLSRFIDRLSGYRLGKSVLLIGRKEG